MNQIEDFFEVKDVPLNSKEIPKDVDVLMLIQPAGLQADTGFAIDQFALRGGRVLAFVDPVPDVGRMMNPGAAGAGSGIWASSGSGVAAGSFSGVAASGVSTTGSVAGES